MPDQIKVKLSPPQLKIIAEFLSNFSLAWLVAGIITPFFAPLEVPPEIAKIKIVFCLIFALSSFILSLNFSKLLDE